MAPIRWESSFRLMREYSENYSIFDGQVELKNQKITTSQLLP